MTIVTFGGGPVGKRGGVSQTALALAAAALDAGDSAVFDTSTTGADVPWANTHQIQQQTSNIYYDATRKEVQVVGKPHSQISFDFSHYLYDEAENTWTLTSSNDFGATGNNGHIWNHAFDPDTGDYYLIVGAGSIIRRWSRAGWDGETATWIDSADEGGDLLNNLGLSGHGGMGWHPNLFGSGDGGIAIRGIINGVGWRKSTDTFHQIAGPYSNPHVHRAHDGGGRGILLSDVLILGTGTDGGQSSGRTPLQLFNAGSGGSVNTSPGTSTNDPPVGVFGSSGSTNFAHMVVDPRDGISLLLLERGSAGTLRWWRSTDGNSWSQETGSHPFFPSGTVQWTLGSIPEYGILWALASGADTGGSQSMIWKPPA